MRGSAGWQIRSGLTAIRPCTVIDKPTFGSTELGVLLTRRDMDEMIGSVTLVGLCTDICVISNAVMAKAAASPFCHIKVDAACCAGVTPESHDLALDAMKALHIEVENQGSEPWR